MRRINVGSDNERIVCRVRIEGTFRGEKWTYEDPEGVESQYIWVKDNDPSIYWWTEGTMSWDGNRWQFLPKEMQALLPEDNDGIEIKIDTITPIEGEGLPILYLNESKK